MIAMGFLTHDHSTDLAQLQPHTIGGTQTAKPLAQIGRLGHLTRAQNIGRVCGQLRYFLAEASKTVGSIGANGQSSRSL